MPEAGKRITNSFGVFESWLARRRARMADALIPPDFRSGAILDIGCGWTPLFLLGTAFARKIGLDQDIDPGKGKAGLDLVVADIERTHHLPFDAGSFEVVTLLAVFEHFSPENLVPILKEIRRVLRKPGRLILTTPCPWTDPLLRLMACFRLVSPEGMREHKGSYNRQAIEGFLEKAGFDRSQARYGFFECFLNSWLYVDK